MGCIVSLIVAAVEGIIAAGATAATATGVAVIAESAAGIAASILAEAIGVTGLDTLASIGLESVEEIGIDYVLSAAARTAVRKVAQKVIAKLSAKHYDISYHNLVTIFSKNYEKVEKTATAVKIARTAGAAAFEVCCTQGEACKKTMALKCPEESEEASGEASEAESNERRLSSGANVTSEDTFGRVNGMPNFNIIGATPDFEFPVAMVCGIQKTVVHSFEDAKSCYLETLRNMRLQVETSTQWRYVAQHGCATLLFGATEDPNDEYCTVFRIGRSGARYDAQRRGGRSVYFTETPQCASIEMATKSMLLASKLLPPDGLIPFFWSPDPTCELPRPGVRVSKMLPPKPLPNDDEAPPILGTVLWLVVSVLGTLLVAAVVGYIMHRRTHSLIRRLRRPPTSKEEGEASTLLTPARIPQLSFTLAGKRGPTA